MFCSIVQGELPASYVAREPRVTAFLDARPLFPGHVLVVPNAHVVTLDELAPEELPALFGLVQRLTSALVRGLGAQGSFVAVNNVVSQSVPHLHVHVVPRTKGDGLKGFFWPRHKYVSDEEREEYARRIREAMS